MDTAQRATEIVVELTRHVPLFKDWHIAVEQRDINPKDEETDSAIIHFDAEVRRAKIFIDVRFPVPCEVYTLEEVIAHELGHIVCGEPCNDEVSATRAGLLLLQWARERANCKCGEQSAEG